MTNQSTDSTEELQDLNYIKCVHNQRRGMLISNPPQYLCEYCGNTWLYNTPTPVCPVLKTVHDRAELEGRIDAAKYFKKYMISTSPFITEILEPYLEQQESKLKSQLESMGKGEV